MENSNLLTSPSLAVWVTVRSEHLECSRWPALWRSLPRVLRIQNLTICHKISKYFNPYLKPSLIYSEIALANSWRIAWGFPLNSQVGLASQSAHKFQHDFFFALSHFDLLHSDDHSSLEMKSSWFCPSMPDGLVTAVKSMHIPISRCYSYEEKQRLIRTPPSHRKSNEAGTRSLGSWWSSHFQKGSLRDRIQRRHGRRARCTHHPRDPRLARCRRCWCCSPRSAVVLVLQFLGHLVPLHQSKMDLEWSWRLAHQSPGEQRNIPNEAPQRSEDWWHFATIYNNDHSGG